MKANGSFLPAKIKYTVLYRRHNLQGKHLERMKEIHIHNPELALAFDLKEEFMEFLDAKNRKEARSKFFS